MKLDNLSIYKINYKDYEGKYLVLFQEFQLQYVREIKYTEDDYYERFVLKSVCTSDPIYIEVFDSEEDAKKFVASKNKKFDYSEEGDSKIEYSYHFVEPPEVPFCQSDLI